MSSDPEPMDLSSPHASAGSSVNSPSQRDATNVTPTPPPSRISKPGDLHIIGQPHETVLYHGDDVVTKLPDSTEEDDSVYEVETTLDDVKSMFRDLQSKRANLEDAPLKGQKLRALEKETAILKSLHDHPNTAIRIRFPDRIIIQGIFRTSSTIADVKLWLRTYLNEPSLDFYIFTAPPKNILQDESKLVDEGLIAKVVIYFGAENMPDNNKVLKPNLYEKLSDPEKAFQLAKEKLKVRTRDGGDDSQEDVPPSNETNLKDHSGESSHSQQPQPVKRTLDKGKVPKWFKMNK